MSITSQLGALLHPEDVSATKRALWALFAAAVAVRWLYTFALYIGTGPDGLMGPDSYNYLAQASELLREFETGGLSGWAWLG